MLQTILGSEQLLLLQQAFQKGDSVLVEELWDPTKAAVIALGEMATGKHVLVLTGGSQEENRLYHDFSLFTNRRIVDFPAWETMPSEAIAPSPDVVGERYKVLEQVLESKEPLIILSSLQAALQRLIPIDTFSLYYLKLKAGDVPGFDSLIAQLKEMGYYKNNVASDKGEFAVRGGIIDIFPVSSPDPFRIEFFGDQIESIRIYDPIGQKSVKPALEITLTPALELEMLAAEKKLQTLLDYLGKNVIVVLDDLLSLEDRYAALVSICSKSEKTFSSIEEFLDQIEPLQKIFFTKEPIEELSEIEVLDKAEKSYYSASSPLTALAFQAFNRKFIAKRWRHPFVSVSDYLMLGEETMGDAVIPGLKIVEGGEVSLYLLSSSEIEQSTFQRKILESGVKLPDRTTYQMGYISSGFALHDIKTVVIPFTEVSRRYKIRRQKQRSTYHTPPSEFHSIESGDSIVHTNNGIGRFLGIEKRVDHNGVENEFFHLEYADDAKLFIPLNQASQITKYIGSNEEAPELSKLGSGKWKKIREKTEQAILGYAHDLLHLYAERTLRGGFSYPPDNADIIAFAEEFPFVETEDQLAAIGAINRDMTSEKPMDRLICGDVGYGKTEVAMRAAFKAVLSAGKQVAVLVPTTVLAMQHYENFIDRMSNFPVRIGVLSRFRKPKEIKETVDAVAKGSVDIVIGTHRIISGDIQFKDLGLIIIDEEQRFGVRAKEHLKKIKTGVDCITLSATPIPRTLYMSLIGARDMSLINTPPQDRLPITTLITEPSDQLIRNALLRELSRDGQAYVIHNRVETIFEYADRLKTLLPQARIAVVHGQMGSDEIDEVFHAFKSGKADILVATTIVESGIDIPNANTILIDRADRFGLADLYQLRGRVGRWNRRAYAYFLVPGKGVISEISRRRLSALSESSGYGGGMKLAMRDLEIRGAGDILGVEQSGHVAAVGFHLYCKMLKRTVRALQGQSNKLLTDCKIEVPLDARLPEKYVNAPNLRMEFYQRLGEAVSFEEIDSIWEEIQDRFGAPPLPALALYHLARIRVFASTHGFLLIKVEKMGLLMEKKKPSGDPLVRKVVLGKYNSIPELEKRIFEKMQEL